jgi:transposase InsO family protein
MKNAAMVLAPLTKLLNKDVTYHWGPEQQSAFEKAKDLLTSSDVLVHYNPELPLILTVDASPYGVGAVLAHRIKGNERPIAFASRSLQKAEVAYAQVEKEGLAVIFGVQRFHKYLYGRQFTIETDHKPLLGLFGEYKPASKVASARIQRWSLMLANYEYHLQYKAGPQIQHADGLSRMQHSEHDKKSPPIPAEVLEALNFLDESTVSSKSVAQWTNRDPVLAIVLEAVRTGVWPEAESEELAPYARRRTELSVDQGCLLWGARVVLPQKARDAYLKELHECHPGIVRMKSLARSFVWWPGIDQEIELAVRSCDTCQRNAKLPASAPLHPWEWPQEPWYRIHVDYAELEGNMILVIVDATTKYLDAHIVRSANSASTITKLMQTFAHLGLPRQIVSDNGTTFTSAEMNKFAKGNGIQQIFVAPYHPSSNGLAEKAVQTIKNSLKATQGGTIEQRLLRVLARYRLTPHTVTGRSPAEMLFGRRPRSRLDLVKPNVRDNIIRSQARDVKSHRGVDRKFFCGDTVYALSFSGKPKWLRAIIQSVSGPLSFVVELEDGRLWRRHADQLRTAIPDGDSSATAQERPPGVPRIVPAGTGNRCTEPDAEREQRPPQDEPPTLDNMENPPTLDRMDAAENSTNPPHPK